MVIISADTKTLFFCVKILYTVFVSEHLGRVRNVVLIKCIFGSGKPWGVEILGRGPHGLNEGTKGSVYEQLGDKVDGSCHSKEGSK